MTISGMCLRGTVAIETDMPVFWAWYDHSQTSRRAHGAAYATYVGGWKSKVRGVGRQDVLARFDDLKRRQVRSFCSLCGTPMMFTRGGLPERVNIPRALLGARLVARAKYHVAIEQPQDGAYLGAQVGPLKGYPGVSIAKVRNAKPARGGFFGRKRSGDPLDLVVVHQQGVAAVLFDQVSGITAVCSARDSRPIHCSLKAVREHLPNDTLGRVAFPRPDNADAGGV